MHLNVYFLPRQMYECQVFGQPAKRRRISGRRFSPSEKQLVFGQINQILPVLHQHHSTRKQLLLAGLTEFSLGPSYSHKHSSGSQKFLYHQYYFMYKIAHRNFSVLPSNAKIRLRSRNFWCHFFTSNTRWSTGIFVSFPAVQKIDGTQKFLRPSKC